MSEQTPRIDLDLDNIVRPPKVVKLNNKLFEVHPPEVHQLFQISKLGSKLQNVRSMTEEQLVETYDGLEDSLKTALNELIPGIKDEKISIEQLMALLRIISTLATPAESLELEKRGISMDSGEKKIPLDYSESSQDSFTSSPATPTNS